MNTSIAALKRSKSNLDTLVSELNKVAEPQKQKNSYADDRFWKPELDKSGNGYAVLDFYQQSKVKIYLGQDYGLMPFKDLVVGTLKTV